MTSSYTVFVLFLSTIVGLVKYQNKPERVFGALLLVLYAAQLATTDQLIASFSNQGLLTLMLIMVCSLALEKTRLLRIIAGYVIREGYRVTWLRLVSLTALSSALLNNTAVVSTMLAPIRNNSYHPASKLLLPLSYAAILGGTLTLVGTSTNLIVNSMVLEMGLPSVSFFEFTPIGAALVLGCGLVLFGISRFLPASEESKAVSTDYFIDTKVSSGSVLVGKTIEANGLRNLESLFLVEVLRDGRLISPVSPSEVLEENDRLVFSGDIKKVTLLEQINGLDSFAYRNGLPLENLTEVVVRSDSILVGKTLKQTGFRALFDAAVVAIKRDGATVSGKLGDVVLQPGDFLVLAVGEDFKARRNISKNFIVLSGVETEQLLSGWQEKLSVCGFLGAILLAATGVVSLFQSMFLLLGLFLFAGVLTPNEVVQRAPKQIWLIIASALVLSKSLQSSGALDVIGDLVRQHQNGFSPFTGLLVIYVLTWLLTELVTNNAAAALMFPIAYGLAVSLSVEPIGYIMAVAFGASASFISPYGYQTNLMVFSAGQYKLGDFVRIGLPVSLVYGVIAVSGISYLYGI
ncbi:SLC13 family permease [Vibrio sp. JC009]|uniref:SLC13 family permease n=1 Tax=Vibrio sp. JC009 TaxID=2912314 RepID=UPI0023AF3672|nr:SLC13 family permease [Vibrio sp. JC009]WED20630.1 SLC13 family permease [Vibrio sp. JC009]